MDKIKIAVTDCSKFDNYARWILEAAGVEVVKLGYEFDNLDQLRKCQGVLLTGGEDVHPKFYGNPELLELCLIDDVDESRDEFELSVLEYTQSNKIPVLGICRGLQIANVYFGGTLIPDIPTFGKFNHSKIGSEDRYHTIRVDENSLLFGIAQSKNGGVNSNHHQAAETVGQGLVANCFSEDGVIEGLEWIDPTGLPFLLLVQWHPERMKDQSNALAHGLRNKFIEEVRLNAESHRHMNMRIDK